jgi:cell division protein FtsI (penicillin-binding protein 3)
MPTVLQLRDLMRDVVENGSGRRSHVLGYDIGGKTGTAEKSSGGGYSHSKNVVSFVGAVPMDNPKYVVLVMLDEPKKGFETGGLSAAPAVSSFMRRFGMMTGLQPDMPTVAAQQLVLERKGLNRHYTASSLNSPLADEREGDVAHEAFNAGGAPPLTDH